MGIVPREGVMSQTDCSWNWFSMRLQLIIGTVPFLHIITSLHNHALYYCTSLTHDLGIADSLWRHLYL